MKKYTLYNIIRRTLLTLCLMVTATVAWAADVANADQLKEALAGTDGTITLTSNISLSETLEINRQVTLDLNGHSIIANGVRAFHITKGDVTIQSTAPALISSNGSIASNSSVIRVGNGFDPFSGSQETVGLTLGENVTVSTDKCYGITVFGSQTKETVIINGTVSTNGVSAVAGNGNPQHAGTTITIGETAVITTSNDVAIYHPQNGTLTVAGTVTGAGGIEIKAGQLIVDAKAKITATGSISHSENNDGTSTRGYAIAIVENEKYAGVQTINVSKSATISGEIAMVKDSENTTTESVTFTPGSLQMLVKVTDSTDKLVGQYLSLELAMKDAPAGSTITLLDDCSIASTIETTKNYTLDLNGHTITSDGQRALWIKSGNVIINSTLAGGKIIVPTISNHDSSVIRVGSNETNAAVLTVENGVTISADECYGITVFGTNSETLTVNGNVETKIRPAISGNGSAGLASTNITIGSTANITTTNEVAIYHPQAGSLTVDGTVTGAGGIEIKGGSLTVGEHATITATDKTPSHVANNDGSSSRGYAIAIVENSQYAGVTAVGIHDSAILEGAVVQLKDSEKGSFNPTYTGNAVAKKVAAIGNDEYFTVKDAIKIVPSEGTVKLLDNLTLDETFVMDAEKTYIFDLATYTLTGSSCNAIQVSHGHVTITNGTITNTGTAPAVIQLGADEGSSRNVSLTLTESASVTSDISTGVLLKGTATRETLEAKGSITTTDHIAIKAADEMALIHVYKEAPVSATGAVAIVQDNTGELVVDGTVEGNEGIRMRGGDLTVSGNAHISASAANNYAIALVENAGYVGVGKANISKDATITGIIACLVESKNNNVAEPLFTGDIYMTAETNNASGFGEKYAKLPEAIGKAIASGEVKLLDDITETETFTIGKAITLNMNDYSVIGKQASDATINITANVTLQNGSISSEHDGVQVTSGTVRLKQVTIKTGGVSLEVANGTVSADQASTVTSTENNTIALQGGSLTLAGKVLNSSTGSDNNAVYATAGDLTIAATAAISSANGKGIDWQSTGTLTVKGGKIMGVEAVYANNGTVTIEGGTFTGTGHAVDIAAGTPTVSGGTFICGEDDDYQPITATSATGFVSGNNTFFSKHIDQTLCLLGYMVSKTPKNNGLFYLIDEIVINDGTIWNNTEAFTIKKAKYVRNSGMGAHGTQFGTLCLPFSFSATQTGMTFYTVNRIDGNTLYLDAVTTADIAAGTPVVFKCTEATTGFTIESTNAAISAVGANSANNLVGTFTKQSITSGLGSIYYLNSDAFHQAKSSLTVPAFRAYIKISSPSPVKEQVLYIHTDDDETDAVEAVQLDGEMEAVYDLQGRKQNGLQRGVNIMKMANGKTIKVYVK